MLPNSRHWANCFSGDYGRGGDGHQHIFRNVLPGKQKEMLKLHFQLKLKRVWFFALISEKLKTDNYKT